MPDDPSLSQAQAAVVALPPDARIFLEGPAGCGKTTAAVQRLLALISAGAAPDEILVAVPQRTLAAPYTAVLRRPDLDLHGMVDVLTFGGLAQRMVDLFWPEVAGPAGFAAPDAPPTFLTLETTQYYMARLMRPLLEQGYFESISIDRNRLYSQILDNLNKAALIGFPYDEIGPRLTTAWIGESAQARVYAEAQECAARFRAYCLEHNLLDFSLQVEVFRDHLWPLPEFREYLFARYRHLVVDNLEEDTPFAHDLLRAWLPACDSALLVYDWEGGYRRFLGADPLSAAGLKELCTQGAVLDRTYVTDPALGALGWRLGLALGRAAALPVEDAGEGEDEIAPERVRGALAYEYHRFYPEMLDWVADQIAYLVFEQGLPPGEIAVLAPFLTDSLRFSLANRLDGLGIPSRSQRPSRSLREEPAVRCLLTLACLAHPQWGFRPTRAEVTYALVQAIDGLDPVRARLLAEIVYRTTGKEPTPPGSFDQIQPDMQGRITYELGQRYQGLRDWLVGYSQGPADEPDAFISRLFGEVLSQPGYGFHTRLDAGAAAATLIESVRKFRWAMSARPAEDGLSIGQEYVQMVADGVISAQYVRTWPDPGAAGAVLLAPAHTFLMSNRPVDVQFWLDVGSSGWWERLYQPLTHPYVLSRQWPAGKVWSDADEFETRQEALFHLTLGLIRRCRQRVYLGLSELGEGGFEQQGSLLRAIQQVLRKLPRDVEVPGV